MVVKAITSRLTLILVILLWAGVVPYTLAQVTEVTGLRAGIDRLYTPPDVAAFFIATVISRLAFGAIWVIAAWKVTEWAEEWGFFWFKPAKPSYRSADDDVPEVDQSPKIFGGLILAAFCLIFSEAAIRIYTGTPLPWE